MKRETIQEHRVASEVEMKAPPKEDVMVEGGGTPQMLCYPRMIMTDKILSGGSWRLTGSVGS